MEALRFTDTQVQTQDTLNRLVAVLVLMQLRRQLQEITQVQAQLAALQFYVQVVLILAVELSTFTE